jgi:acetyltransferase-like isoleucine patch superfamily enzyme
MRGLNGYLEILLRLDHRPLYVKKLFDSLNTLYSNHYIKPQFDGVGQGCEFTSPRHIFISGARINLGNRVHVMALRDKPVRLAVFPTENGEGSIHIGNYSIINPGVRITSASGIKIGDSCMIAMNAYLSDADWHDIHHRIFAPGKSAPIHLEKNVWIGDSALVTKGVTIGENSVVGAYSVVTKDVPANSIVVGNPARVVRDLDASHLTTREHLFNGPIAYDEFQAEYFEAQLRDNRLSNWLRSLLAPGVND